MTTKKIPQKLKEELIKVIKEELDIPIVDLIYCIKFDFGEFDGEAKKTFINCLTDLVNENWEQVEIENDEDYY